MATANPVVLHAVAPLANLFTEMTQTATVTTTVNPTVTTIVNTTAFQRRDTGVSSPACAFGAFSAPSSRRKSLSSRRNCAKLSVSSQERRLFGDFGDFWRLRISQFVFSCFSMIFNTFTYFHILSPSSAGHWWNSSGNMLASRRLLAAFNRTGAYASKTCRQAPSTQHMHRNMTHPTLQEAH